MNEALQEWDMSTSNGLETPGIIDECDVKSQKVAEFMSKEGPQSTKELQHSSITFHLTIP